MAQLRQDYAEFEAREVQIVAISPEGPDELARLWQKHDLPFIGIPDPGRKIARSVGQEFKLLRLGYMPALLVVDHTGVIRYTHYGKSMSDIPANKTILFILDRLAAEKHAEARLKAP